jgi:hypothetical protein
MAAPEEPSPEQLLARALESLSSDDRQRVTMWLLSRVSPGLQLGWLGRQERDQLMATFQPGTSLRELYASRFTGSTLAGEGHQVVPVRLPTDLHSRLRTWSAEHGFSMATVVRGLVSRFLDGQQSGQDAQD